mgnify:CR=1 FL=1
MSLPNSSPEVQSLQEYGKTVTEKRLPSLDSWFGFTRPIPAGSRLMAGSRTNRSPKREFISRSYNLLTKVSHFTRIQDMQCGFKAISRRAAQELVPLLAGLLRR